MLGLKLETDPRWVNIVEKNIEEILTDHAYCEQKAATNAISILISYSYHPELVDEMLSLAKEELTHFEMVHQKIKDRGYKLGFERKDEYVLELYKFMRKGHVKEIALIDRLLFSAMVEARSCERFKILSEKINDADLRQFYHDLMVSEANHYTMYLAFARKYGNGVEDVNARWQQWLEHEATILKSYGKQETIHG
ncbi:MAG: tRNA-(ms[2]io[6]A)-hydroxylase [Bacteroidota bacterium]|nr:tRNA-(ms[2]io[6]A)-hydroxylase [Bacteroidota bacterium]MDP3146404.1 tRNA-(ms[2]io[6]A)-hydroxylase [Bacteroidota bacterium]MDP3557390.1 tRNA-(ms[2]io[6]A)-hydroxylase [Bacteroidota bacterium]